MTIEASRAAAIAAFRAGKRAGHLDALKIITELLDAPYGIEEKQALMEAAERISRLKHLEEKAA